MSGHTYTHTHTHTHDNYYNPRCAHAHRGLTRIHRVAQGLQATTQHYHIRHLGAGVNQRIYISCHMTYCAFYISCHMTYDAFYIHFLYMLTLSTS